MYLKRIELNGFKSFPNKKEIMINEGITGVVGPNGSGKSNIADALRWVLGEQSSKNLRGSTMQDVIFNGTQSRPKKGYCEVSLVFDNADRRIDTDFTEICIARKMYRSGECEYSINHAGCRLKDILEMFRDTGIGKEGYSIIGQGRIDEILNSKAVARRRVFEEAAGIMKYRVRKEEAERNLQKTRDNIVRLDDIIAELQTQIGPLEEQMKEARDYLSMREQLKQLEINLFLYQYDRSAERIEKLNRQMEEQEQEYEDTAAQVSALGMDTGRVKQTLKAVQDEIEAHNSRVAELMRDQEKLKGEAALAEEKEKNYRASLAEGRAKREEHERVALEHSRQIEEIDSRIEEMNGALDEKYEQICTLRNTVLGMSGHADAVAEKVGEIRQNAEALRTELQTLEIDCNENMLRAEWLGKQAEEQGNRLKEQQAYAEKLEEQAALLATEEQRFAEQSADLRRKTNENVQEMAALRADKQKKDDAIKELNRVLSEDRSRYKLIADMREEYEGYFDSVKSLLNHSKNVPEICSRIRGVLAEVVDVPKKYELPLEVILGNALQNIVVDTDADAKAVIGYLRENNLGRITFLPAKSLKVKYLRDEERRLIERQEGVLCVASEAVECGNDVRPAVDFLLARTVIVRDMDSAIALMKRTDYAFRAVTMQGDFIKPGGVITGGSIKNTNTGLLARKRLAQEMHAAIGKNTKALAMATAELEQAVQHEKRLTQAQQELFAKLRETEIGAAEVKQRLLAAQRQSEEKDAAFLELKQEAEEREAELRRVAARAQEDEALREEAEKKYEAAKAALFCAEQEQAEKLKLGAEQKEALSAMEMEQAELNSQKNLLLSKAEHERETVHAAEEGIETAQRQEVALSAELDRLQVVRRELREKMDDLLVDVKNAGVMAQENFGKRDALLAQIEQNAQKAEELNAHKNLLIEQKYKLIAGKEKTELARENMQAKIWDDYALTYANAAAYREDDFAYQTSVKQIEEIKEAIRGMGSVNPNAIEDYARVRERYDNLTVQRADLTRAGEDLQVVINNLLEGMKKSFGEKFALINSNFTRVFRELFGGGNAQLELLSDGDIMECGIEIIAEPPGKKLQSISLLSGGEKALTAIALLFSMLSINPSPVCLLDEIDAPLDDANVIRLSDYLTRLSKELQFIVITHRKPTMAICNTLYGIAMHEKGVSDIVSVKLN